MQIKQSTLMFYYCYDVSDEIDLTRVETILGQKPQISKLVSERIPTYVQYKVAPLLVRIGEHEFSAGDRNLKASVEAKLYDFGVVTLRLSVPIAGTLDGVGKVVTGIDKPSMDKFVRSQLKNVLFEIKDALVNARKPQFWEDYTILSINKFDKTISGAELLKRHGRELAPILCCEKNELSDQEIGDALREPLSYYKDELVLIDWDAAVIYNPRVGYDVADVIEFALISSLELRMYDSVLDHALDIAYNDIANAGKKLFSLSPYAKTIKFLTQTKLEVSEMVDKVEHALKIVGDIHLAKVYNTSAKRFWLENLKSSVKDKMVTIESTYKMLHDKASARMMNVLEVMIVALFVIDLVLIALGK